MDMRAEVQAEALDLGYAKRSVGVSGIVVRTFDNSCFGRNGSRLASWRQQEADGR